MAVITITFQVIFAMSVLAEGREILWNSSSEQGGQQNQNVRDWPYQTTNAPCVENKYNHCVCSAVYCDTITHVPDPANDEFLHVSTSKDTPGFRLETVKRNGHDKDGLRVSESVDKTSVVFQIFTNTTYQTIVGFGGAFTDSSGINIAQLSEETQDKLLRSYFSPDGIEYNLGRVPIASTDFSTHVYSYNDHSEDLDMKNFSLTPEDLKLKIPLIQRARDMSQKDLLLFGSAWSAPGWMKTNDNMVGGGYLRGTTDGAYYKAWAKYHLRFLEEYAKANITFWGLTTGNEPTEGQLKSYKFQALGFTAETQRDFIKMHLGPTLAANGFADVNIMMLDDFRLMLPHWAQIVLADPVTRVYVSGVAVHWYGDNLVPSDVLTQTHDMYPEKFILATEACNPWSSQLSLEGSWLKAEAYAQDIITDLNHWVSGWVDWNLALDMSGGPSWIKNYVDSPILVDKDRDVFYKQPMFYIMGHFSKFLLPGSVRLSLRSSRPDDALLPATIFLRPDKSKVLLVSNLHDSAVSIKLTVDGSDLGVISLDGHSMNTYLWK